MKGTDNRNDDILEELFQHASARQRPGAEDERAIRDAVHWQWREMVRRRKRKRLMISFAAAASIALAVWVTIPLLQQSPVPVPPVPLATVEKVHGNVFQHQTGAGEGLPLLVSATVVSGQQILTGLQSRLALRWRDGTSLRMDQNSEIRLDPNGIVELVAGQLYVDSEAAQQSTSPLVIRTTAGSIRHVGTQYMTRFSSGETRVSVREGRVAVEVNGVDFVANQGEQLIVESNGDRDRRLVNGYGEPWEWAQSMAPEFELDGRSLSEFLAFVGRETGRTIEFTSPQAKKLAGDTLLRGTVEFEPVRALDAVLLTTDLESRIRGGEIFVTLRQ